MDYKKIVVYRSQHGVSHKLVGKESMNILIIGASSGLGDSISKELPVKGDQVWLVSRSNPNTMKLQDGVTRKWIEADLRSYEASQKIANELKGASLNVLIYVAGIWETHSKPQDNPAKDIYDILSVNTSGFIILLQSTFNNLLNAERAKIIAIGSIVGLDNGAGQNLAYSASKFGLRGACHSAREWLREYGIPVTCISPGSITERQDDPDRLPHTDLIKLIHSIMSMSASTCVKEVTIPAMLDSNV